MFPLYLVTKPILQQLVAQPFIQERYYISDVDGRTFNGRYEVIQKGHQFKRKVNYTLCIKI